MVSARIIPCLDVRDGRVVKGIKFQGLVDSGDPVERAAAYEAQGADELCILDVSATNEGRANAIETVTAVRAVLGIPLTVGGGVRALSDAARLLDAGADKVAVNTAALARPELLREIHDSLGAQCTVLSLDAGRRLDDPTRYEIITHGGTKRTGVDAIEWARQAAEFGIGEILATSWDRDGTGEGYDLELLRELSRAVPVPIIASGGARHAEHMAEAFDAGASAVLAASIFHRGELTVADVKRTLIACGHDLRLTP
ncbi:Imidazole glycerol phosphate synthase subunit HisF [Planctomycetes bacterium Poly30]|uniref:Imidazole glycerol phosphate synthase subunit HisF n=1 Tax=Saltatorellus ferox TaxID=2528018 RepID=A0A518EPI3_9BACT|nr:Imidazole glycerol phosphate synthase subunit HisF [Planctomycetes bacterium Poly30]